MSKIRYYAQEYDSTLFLNRGWRGFLVHVMSYLAAWLQRKVEWHIMHLVTEEQSLPEAVIEKLERVFHEQDSAPIDDLAPFRNLVRKRSAMTDQTYQEQRKAKSATTFARYLNTGRAGRYAQGRKQRYADPDGIVKE